MDSSLNLASHCSAPKSGHRIAARQRLGQYFLVDPTVLAQILSASEVGPEDTVVEVGPGRGALTRELVARAKAVIAIELDSGLAACLGRALGDPPNLHVINDDAREIDLDQVLEGLESYKLVANLPYYAASPILRRFLEAGKRRPSVLVVTIQREVAKSMVAEGGRMSLLAVAIQLYGVPRIIGYVPPGAFRPQPKVTSAIVRIDPLPNPAVEVADVDEFFHIVRAGYFAPRKQLRNSLSLGLGIPAGRAGDLLESAGVQPGRRAENLSLAEWERIYRAAGGR